MGWENIHQKLFRGAFLKPDEQILFGNDCYWQRPAKPLSKSFKFLLCTIDEIR